MGEQESKTKTPAALPAKARVDGFDIARAVAIAGMVVVNFRHNMEDMDLGPEVLRELASLVDGRAAATFVVLAGVGVSLMGRRARLTGDMEAAGRVRRALLVRGAILFGVGLLHLMVWPADILHFYGIFLPLGGLALLLPDRALHVLAGTTAAGFVGLYVAFDYELGWDQEILGDPRLWTAGGFFKDLVFNGYHPVFPWLAFLFYGMWLGRRPLHEARVRTWVLGVGLAVVVACESLVWLGPELVPAGAEDADWAVMIFTADPSPPTPLYMLAAGGVASVVIALCTWLGQVASDRLKAPLVRTGQMALTLYISHVVLGIPILSTLEDWMEPSMVTTFVAVGLFLVLALVCSHLWIGRFGRGPLEWLMRKLVSHPRFRT